ncbi:hypothetical protein D3C74_348210 [compost metagenome]
MAAGNTDRIANSEAVEFIDVFRTLHIIHFIDCQHDRLPGPEQNLRYLFICIRKTAFRFAHKDDNIRFLNRQLRLNADRFQNRIFTVNLNPSGINYAKGFAVPIGNAVNPVTSNPRFIFYNGQSITNQPVKYRRFPDVRPAYNGHNGSCHIHSSCLPYDFIIAKNNSIGKHNRRTPE